MEDLKNILLEFFEGKTLVQATFSLPVVLKKEGIQKVSCRPFLLQGKIYYQFTVHQGAQVIHRNLLPYQAREVVETEFFPYFQQLVFQTETETVSVYRKSGKVTIKRSAKGKQSLSLHHNREKKYILQEGTRYPFLIELGICTKNGAVVVKKRDKFIQVNRFLETVADTLDLFEGQKKLKAVDFGCGKAYLTFALYYFLTEIRGFDVALTGIDLKETVLKECQELACRLGFKGLQFFVGKISDYAEKQPVDIAVSLHACDTATDVALAKAVQAKTKVILAAPCCQHELRGQIKAPILEAILGYGILKERFSALSTDAVRGELLKIVGYKTQILEFIDPEHTPKNTLIRAIWGNTDEERKKAAKNYIALTSFLDISPSLERHLSLSIGVDEESCHVRKGDKS